MRSTAALAIGTAFLLTACGPTRHVACNAALAQPSLLVDLRVFAATHSGVTGSLCPQITSDPSASRLCATFSLTAAGLLASSTGNIRQGPRPDVLRLYLIPGDDRLVVHLQAHGVDLADGSVELTGHRDSRPCGGFIYSNVRISASGAPSIE